MQPIHIKLEFDEAVRYKRHILEAELNLLNASKHLDNFKELRKLEFKKKIFLRSKLKNLALKISLIMRELPHVEVPMIEKREVKILDRKKKKFLEDELREIRRKLERLQS